MPQQKKTDKIDLPDPSQLPRLTNKQQAFLDSILSGMSDKDAYIEAYDCENMADRSIRVAAARLRVNASIAQHLRCHQLYGFARGQVTLEEHILELTRIREMALETGNYGAAVNAEVNRGKASGLHIEHKHVHHSAEQELLDALKILPQDMRAHYAKQFGLEKWLPETRH